MNIEKFNLNSLGIPNSNIETRVGVPPHVYDYQQEQASNEKVTQADLCKFTKSRCSKQLPDSFINSHLNNLQQENKFHTDLKRVLTFLNYLPSLNFEHTKSYLETLKACSLKASEGNQKEIIAITLRKVQKVLFQKLSDSDSWNEASKNVLNTLFAEIVDNLRSDLLDR